MFPVITTISGVFSEGLKRGFERTLSAGDLWELTKIIEKRVSFEPPENVF